MELREAYLLMKLMKPEGGGATVGGSGKVGTVIIENDVRNSYISLMTIEELGFIPHVFVLYPKNLDTSVDCVLLLGAMDGTEIDPMVYGNAMFALSRGSRTSSSYGQVWTNTGTYNSPRLKLSAGTIWAKGSFDWPLKAGEYQWYAI